jgi:formylglycine-generating enzyme required for sulfatase activity
MVAVGEWLVGKAVTRSVRRTLVLCCAVGVGWVFGCGLERNSGDDAAAGMSGSAGDGAGSGGAAGSRASGGSPTSGAAGTGGTGGTAGTGGTSTAGTGGTTPGGEAGESSSGGSDGCDDPNDCGGCGTLSASIGETCGRCGQYECTTDRADVTCVDPGLNECGGCGVLSEALGEPCGECGSYTCTEDDSDVTCTDPGLNECGGCGEIAVPPGTSCGTCGPYECSPDNSTTVCTGTEVNACGGCGTLDATPGSPCGQCGTYECSSDKSSVACDDPGENSCGACGELAAEPGSPCGQCGTYECSSDMTSVSCVGDTTRVNCSNNAPQQCDASGQWDTDAACSGSTPRCVDGECYACTAASDCPAPKANACLRAVCTSNRTCDFTVSSGTSCPAGGTCNSSGNCVRSPVTVDGYNIDATEVTVGQYAAFLAARGGSTSGQPAYCSWNTTFQPESAWPRAAEFNDMPVAWVDWCDAYAYCQWAGRRLCGKIGGGSNLHHEYDNPAQSQWMHACSGPNNTLFPYGNTHNPTRCNGPDNQVDTALAVGQKTMCVGGYPGLHDMSGNLWEFEDSCEANVGSSDICRWRGASYVGNNDGTNGVFLQCNANNNNARSETDSSAGFRCCSN